MTLPFILQQALGTHSVPMRGISFKTVFGGALLASALLSSPAHATLSASPFTAKKAGATILLKNKSQPNRNCNCPKPRPILM